MDATSRTLSTLREWGTPGLGLVALAWALNPAWAGQVKVKGTTASSSYPPENGVSYDSNRARDGKVSTSWVEGDDGSGLGSWIEVDLGEQVAVQRLKIWGGLWYSSEYWERANRPKDIEVAFDDGAVEKLSLADEMKPQEFTLSTAHTTDSVRIKVESVHNGSTWYDTAISEIQVFDTSPDARAPVASVTASSVAPQDADGSYPPVNVLDGIVDTMWCEGNEDGDGVGETLTFTLKGSSRVGSLHMVNGMGTSLAFWMKANRATSATLVFSDGSSERVAIKNTMLPQVIDFSPRTTTSVQIRFDEVAQGKEFNDLCISEAYFKG